MHENTKNTEPEPALTKELCYITFGLDSVGEIYCDCSFDGSGCSLEAFGDMFYQIFSGDLYAPTIMFLNKYFSNTNKEELAKKLSLIIKEKFEKAALDATGDEVVIKPSDLGNRLNPTKQ